MGQLDGVGRIFQTDLSHRVGHDLQVDRTEHDRKRGDKDDRRDEEPKDTVEIHDEAERPEEGSEASPKPKPDPPEEDGLDISA